MATTEFAKKKSKKKQQRNILILLSGVLGLILLGLILYLAAFPAQKETSESPAPAVSPVISFFTPKAKIPKGVTIGGIPVGGMTEERAAENLSAVVSHEIEEHNMIVSYGGKQLTLHPSECAAAWDIPSAVKKALQGESQTIELELLLDKTTVMQKLRTFFKQFGGVYSPSGYWVEGEMPDIDTKNGKCQTLVLAPGSSGIMIDLEDVYDQIKQAFLDNTYLVSLEDAGEIKTVRTLELDEIFRQVTVNPVNPKIDHDSLEVIPGKHGYGFDVDKAKALLENSKDGENIRLTMEYLEPAVSLEDAWYQDTLGYCKTPHNDNENRNENLRLACSMLNGKILQPGEILSYNETLGKRTREAGYKPAPAYSGVDLVDEIGGGICQVSSTLYLSSLLGEVTIVERRNHGFPANYIPMGLDATVNWGTTDLKIRNDYDLPVKILAEVDDEYVKVRIMGVELRDYYVKMEYRVDDHPSYAAAYRCRYDRETDEEIYRALDHTSIYLEEVWCWPGYAENAVDEVNTEND